MMLSVVYEGIEGKYMVFENPEGTRFIFADGGQNSDGEGAVIEASGETLPDPILFPPGSQAEQDFYQNYAETQLGM